MEWRPQSLFLLALVLYQMYDFTKCVQDIHIIELKKIPQFFNDYQIIDPPTCVVYDCHNSNLGYFYFVVP